MKVSILPKEGTLSMLVVVVLLASISLISCSSSKSDNPQSLPIITTSSYPVEFAAKAIVGEEFRVINLVSPGTEPHDFELTPNLTSELLNSDLAVVLGGGFQPAIEKTARSRENNTLVLMEKIDSKSKDPHIWLDPTLMQDIAKEITIKVIKLDPKNESKYKANETKMLAKLDSIDQQYKTALKTCEIRTFVTSHDAFSRLASRYGLIAEPISRFAPGAEPTPKRIEELKKLIQSKKIEIIFTEEIISKKVSDALVSESNVSTQVLSSIESLSLKQKEDEKDYFTIMAANLSQLAKALRCS